VTCRGGRGGGFGRGYLHFSDLIIVIIIKPV